MKVYGPYVRKDGRSHVVLYENGVRTTQSYPRYLMEKQLGRKLLDHEHVDHINDDPSDNRIENLQILSPAENNKKSARGIKIYSFICPTCNNAASVPMSRYLNNQVKQGKTGPYCSRSCAGKQTSRPL